MSSVPLTPVAVLARAEATVRERRRSQVEGLRLVLAWADLHGHDPQRLPGAIPVRFGGDQLIEIGGDGTPLVQDLCLGELAVARQAHVLSTRSTMADALDLRHRAPLTWAKVQDLVCEPWVAGKVASRSRELDRHRVAVVDAAVAAAIACAPGRS